MMNFKNYLIKRKIKIDKIKNSSLIKINFEDRVMVNVYIRVFM